MAINDLFMLLGGLGLFLYGMKLMSDGLKLVAGFKLKKLLGKFTNNKWLAALAGGTVTLVVQSSTATTVMAIGFVNSSLMTLKGAVGVIIGAKVGSSLTGLLFTFNIQTVAPLIIFIGTLLMLFFNRKKVNHQGMILMGFGVLFLGLNLMSSSMIPLSEEPWMNLLFEYSRNPFVGILIGFLVTALIQSSTATIGIIISMISVGIITDLNQAIFILYGLNLGTCVTALLASVGTTKSTKQAAIFPLIFNIFGVAIFLTITSFAFDFAGFVQTLTNNVNVQLVYAHILFNVTITLLLLPFSRYFIKMTEFFVRNVSEVETEFKFNYIDVRMLNNPSIVLEQTNQEIGRLSDIVLDNYIISSTIVTPKEHENKLETIAKNEELINYLNREINKFLVSLNTMTLNPYEIETINSCYKTIASLERMGDLSKDTAYAINQHLKDRHFSEEAILRMEILAKKVEESLTSAFELFKNDYHDEKVVDEIKAKTREIKKLIEAKGVIQGISLVRISSNLNRLSHHALIIAKNQRYKKVQEETEEEK